MTLHQRQTHPEYVEGCFACKIGTIAVQDLQIKAVSHANEKELNAYASARRQGVQPKSTKMKDIQQAVRASDKLGTAVKA